MAYRSQSRNGYESDRWKLIVLDRPTGALNVVSEGLDCWVQSCAWEQDSKALFLTVVDRGRQSIQMIPAGGGGSRVIVSGPTMLDDMQLTADGKTMIYSGQSGSAPTELYRAASSGGTASALTHLNDELLSQYQLTPLEEFWVEGPQQAPAQSFIVNPPYFHSHKKYPVLLLIHAGPEGE